MLPAEVSSGSGSRESSSETPGFRRLQRARQALPFLVAGWAVLTVCRAQLIGWTTDWHVFWTAGHAVVTGHDPYAAVLALHGGYPLFYPGPALLLLAPFGLLSSKVAWLAWAAVTGGLFGLAARRHGRGLWIGALSACFAEAVTFGQWVPLLIAAAILPWLSGALTAKPSIGAALWLWRPTRSAVVGGVALVVVSLVVVPGWPAEWFAALRQTNHIAPIMKPWGWVLLLAAIRWRSPEGRLFLALAFIPQTTSLYESLPLFLVCRRRWDGYALAIFSHVAAFVQEQYFSAPGQVLETVIANRWPVFLVTLWLPALIMVLRPAHPTDWEPRPAPGL